MCTREHVAEHQKRPKHHTTTGTPKDKTELCHQTEKKLNRADRNHMQFDLFTTEHSNIGFGKGFYHLLRAINSSHFHKNVHEIFPPPGQDPFSGGRRRKKKGDISLKTAWQPVDNLCFIT